MAAWGLLLGMYCAGWMDGFSSVCQLLCVSWRRATLS